MRKKRHPRGWAAIPAKYSERYIKAVDTFVEICEQPAGIEHFDIRNLYQLRALFIRPIDQDRPDFGRVWAYLHKPKKLYLKNVIVQLYKLGDAIKVNEWNRAEKILRGLASQSFIDRIKTFKEHLIFHARHADEDIQQIAKGSEDIVTPDASAVNVSIKTNEVLLNRPNVHSRLENLLQAPSDLGHLSIPFDPNVIQERKLQHESLLQKLIVFLSCYDCHLMESRNIDLLCAIENEHLLFEAKTIDSDNELNQVRSAVSQLYEYRFNYRLDTTLWLVLSNPLSRKNQWLIDYLLDDRKIEVLWLSDTGFDGPSMDKLKQILKGQ